MAFVLSQERVAETVDPQRQRTLARTSKSDGGLGVAGREQMLLGAGTGSVLILRWLWERINLYSELAAMIVALLYGVFFELILSFVPAVGPALVWIPAAIWLLATGAVWQGLVVIFSGVAVIGMADNVLRPALVGRDTGIPDWIILVTKAN